MISLIYDGGGTTNALQVAADLDAVIALGTQATAIFTGNHTGIELFLSGAANDATAVVVMLNHEVELIALDTLISAQEASISTPDMAFQVDRSVWGLAATTDHEPKKLLHFPCATDTWVSFCLQDAGATAWYMKYRFMQLNPLPTFAGASTAAGGAATEAKQDDNIAQVAAAAADLNELTAAPVEKLPVLVSQYVAVASTAEALAAGGTEVRKLMLQAKKVTGDNTGNVHIGLAALDQGAAEMFELTPGATFELDMPAGCMVDLNDIYIDADTADDGVIGWYIPV